MAADPRDELWTATFDTYYDVYYEELLAGALVRPWQRADAVTKVLVALTASGSAVAGWALWSQPGLKTAWTLVASIAALLSIIHTTLNGADHVKQNVDSEHRFSGLRSDLETFRYEMRINPDFDLALFARRFVEYRKQLASIGQLAAHDLLTTERLRNRIQDDLDAILEPEIETGGVIQDGNEEGRSPEEETKS